MNSTPRKRRVVRTAVLTLAVPVLLVVWYVASSPFVYYAVERYYPASEPISHVFYAPLFSLQQHDDIYAARQFCDYYRWCRRQLHELLS